MRQSCIDCGRYTSCTSYKISAEGDATNTEDEVPPILIVVGYPTEKDDTANRMGYASHEFLSKFLSRLEVNYVITYAVKCYGGKDEKGFIKPDQHHKDKCRELLVEEIRQYKPGCIVWLGAVAMEVVFGPNSPGSVNAALKGGIITDFGDIPIMGGYSPTTYKKKRSLIDEYLSLFTMAEKICKGELVDTPFDHTVILKDSDLPTIPASANPIFIDIEVRQTEDHPDMVTYYHPKAKLLCLGFTYLYKGTYYNYVLDEHMCRKDVFLKLFKGKTLYAQKTTYDFGGIEALMGVDVYDVAEDWGDTLNDSHWFQMDSKSLGLKYLANYYFGAEDYAAVLNPYIESAYNRRKMELKTYKKAIKQGLVVTPLGYDEPYATFEDVPKKILHWYNAQDGFWTARIYHEVLKHKELWERYKGSPVYSLLKRGLKFINYIEKHGMRYTESRLNKVREEAKSEAKRLKGELAELPEIKAACAGFSYTKDEAPYQLRPYYDKEKELYVWPPTDFNVRSTKFLNNFAAYTRCHPGTEADGGSLSFKKEIIEPIVGIDPENPIPYENLPDDLKLLRRIYDVRMLKYLSSNTLSKIVKYGYNGRLRSQYSLTSTATGRLASKATNLQNVKKGSKGRWVFVPDPKHVFVSIDYDRIELVILAWLSREPKMLEALRRGDDLHRLTADLIGANRDTAKTVNFLTVYGGGAAKLAAKAGISEAQAQIFINEFFASYPAITDYYKSLDKTVRSGEPLFTPWERMREFVLTGKFWIDSRLQRQWRNFPVQSTASDLTLNAACNCLDFILENDIEHLVRPVNIIHDDVMYQVHEEYVESITEHLRTIMTDATNLPFEIDVPLNVGFKIGRNWLEMEEYKMIDGRLVKK